jgi:hypothetical protein
LELFPRLLSRSKNAAFLAAVALRFDRREWVKFAQAIRVGVTKISDKLNKLMNKQNKLIQQQQQQQQSNTSHLGAVEGTTTAATTASEPMGENEVKSSNKRKKQSKDDSNFNSSLSSSTTTTTEEVKRVKVSAEQEDGVDDDIDLRDFLNEVDCFCDSLSHFEVRVRTTQGDVSSNKTTNKSSDNNETSGSSSGGGGGKKDSSSSSSSEGASGAPPMLFAFQEGMLVRAVREGHWLLLDEINLASAETLQVFFCNKIYLCVFIFIFNIYWMLTVLMQSRSAQSQFTLCLSMSLLCYHKLSVCLDYWRATEVV